MKYYAIKTLLTLLILLSFYSMIMPRFLAAALDDQEDKEKIEKVDDWQFVITPLVTNSNVVRATASKPITNISALPNLIAQHNSIQSKSLGFAVGGAKDTSNFLLNLQNDYLPRYDSITYEGLFYDYYFDTGVGTGECQDLFCPSYARAMSKDIYSGENNYYLSVGLNSGLTKDIFQRKKLNIVVVLDISGSMKSSFTNYHYDQKKTDSPESESKKSKMQVAKESIVAMMKHLTNDDRLGVVLFDNKGYLAKPLRLVSHTDMDAISKHILEIHSQGGTNWKAGYDEGVKLFTTKSEALTDQELYENRIIFLTDAMPNSGELDKGGLFDMIKDAADNEIYTSFIGIGIDFNPELVEHVTKIRGANYFFVGSASEFKKRLTDEFDFMVTPLVFDLTLQIKSDDYTIEGVYGSPEANLATGNIMAINTLFPSAIEEEQVKGGMVLIKLKKVGKENTPIGLTVSYKDGNGKQFRVTDSARFDNNIQGFDNNGIRKAVLLTEYVSLIKNWLLDSRKACNDNVEDPVILPLPGYGIINPGTRPEISMLSKWESKSCPLNISAGYRKFFSFFSNHFKKEMQAINDKTLKKEFEVLTLLTEGNLEK